MVRLMYLPPDLSFEEMTEYCPSASPPGDILSSLQNLGLVTYIRLRSLRNIFNMKIYGKILFMVTLTFHNK